MANWFYFHFFFFFFPLLLLSCGLTTCQPLRGILCRLPEKGRKGKEELVSEEKKEDRGEWGLEENEDKVNDSEETEGIFFPQKFQYFTKTMEIQIRCHILWHLIWIYIILLYSYNGALGKNGLTDCKQIKADRLKKPLYIGVSPMV